MATGRSDIHQSARHKMPCVCFIFGSTWSVWKDTLMDRCASVVVWSVRTYRWTVVSWWPHTKMAATCRKSLQPPAMFFHVTLSLSLMKTTRLISTAARVLTSTGHWQEPGEGLAHPAISAKGQNCARTASGRQGRQPLLIEHD